MIGDDRLQVVEAVHMRMLAELPNSKGNCEACRPVLESCQSCDISDRVGMD